MSLGYFFLAVAISASRITLCFSLWPEFPGHSQWHTRMDVGKVSSSSLRKAPFFFLLASEPGNFGRKACRAQTGLDHRLAVYHAGLGLIPVCHGREKKTIHFCLWFKGISRILPLSFCLLQMWQPIWETHLRAGSLMAKPTCLNSAIFGIWPFVVPLERKPHPSPGSDSLLQQPPHATDVAFLLLIPISEGMTEQFCVSSPAVRNGGMWSTISSSSSDPFLDLSQLACRKLVKGW